MDINNKKATRQSYGEALAELGKENPNIVVLDADLSTATKTNIFAKEFPERFFDMGNSRTKFSINSCRNVNMWENTIC